jgi:hypothetical protein
MIYLILILSFLSGFFNNVMDTIIHHVRQGNKNWISSLFKKDTKFKKWLVTNNYYIIEWKQHNPRLYKIAIYFSAFRDGWHCSKWMSYTSLFLIIWILTNFYIFIISYLLWTLGFIILYGSYKLYDKSRLNEDTILYQILKVLRLKHDTKTTK